MRRGAADQRLPEEKKCGHGHEFQRGALRIGGPQIGGLGRRQRTAMPAQIGELAKREQDNGRAGQQKYDADGAIEQGATGGKVAGQWIVREIVGVGVCVARSFGARCPGCPCEERRKLAQFSGIADGAHAEPAVARGDHEIVRPFANLAIERSDVCLRDG